MVLLNKTSRALYADDRCEVAAKPQRCEPNSTTLLHWSNFTKLNRSKKPRRPTKPWPFFESCGMKPTAVRFHQPPTSISTSWM